MKLIADCGATKSNWILIDPAAGTEKVSAAGINVSTMDTDSIRDILESIASAFRAKATAVRDIHIYMAGILTDADRKELSALLTSHFPAASIEFQSDLIAAARAVCGHEPGIAAILGTGSNSCFFDGERIVRQVRSGGFILGDEGSAATLGRTFLADFLKGLIPDEIAQEFSSLYPSGYADITGNVYRSGSPSGYLGSFAPFILKHYSHPYIKDMVDDNIRNFFRRCISQYDTDKFNVGIVGSFGYVLKDIITEIAEKEGIRISRFLQDPIDALVEYHSFLS